MEESTIVTIGDTEVRIVVTKDGFEATEGNTFVEYLREEVFTLGGYAIETDATMWGDAQVAEFSHEDLGRGFVTTNDMERAIEDPNVGVHSIKNGWLNLTDER